MPYLADDPAILAAFETLIGERPIPRDIDSTAHLKHCRAVIRKAMNQAISIDLESAAPERFRPMVSPQMREAGACVLQDWRGILDSESLAEKVYIAMTKSDTGEWNG